VSRCNGPYDEELKQAVLDGKVSMKTLDTMIVRRLATEIRFGLFDHPATIVFSRASMAGSAPGRQLAPTKRLPGKVSLSWLTGRPPKLG